jgi:hypothetical protein
MLDARHGARLAVVLSALAPVFALPAAGGDSMPAGAWLQQPRPQVEPVLPARPAPCPTTGAADTATAIDCEVNEALGARPTASGAATKPALD